jgi:nitroimidazol reductase NimA-like FMN-containing flavoprotein (pyridoxamine 5'-phosphate oxidase superfamily)
VGKVIRSGPAKNFSLQFQKQTIRAKVCTQKLILACFEYLCRENLIAPTMNNSIPISDYIKKNLQSCRLAVMATECDGQPHASLIAITPVSEFRQMIFATYRNTRKFENLLKNSRVAVLIQGEDTDVSFKQTGYALTAYGNAQEVDRADYEEVMKTHVQRNPDLAGSLKSDGLAIFLIKIETYQVVRGFDDVSWWPVSETNM